MSWTPGSVDVALYQSTLPLVACCLFVSLSLCLFVSLPFCRFVSLSVCVFVSLSLCLFVSLSLCLFVPLSFLPLPSISLLTCLFIFLAFAPLCEEIGKPTLRHSLTFLKGPREQTLGLTSSNQGQNTTTQTLRHFIVSPDIWLLRTSLDKEPTFSPKIVNVFAP